MEKDDAARITALLEQIRDNQLAQIELAKRLAERTDRIQNRAEELQAKSAGIVKSARRSVAFILPVVVVLIVYVSWLIFR